MANEIRAAVDIGTNSILLLIAQKASGVPSSLVPILDQAQTVRLGENLLATGYISEPAMERTLTGLSTYVDIIEDFDGLSAKKIFCFGTEALRRATNAQVFCQQVYDQLGLELRILSPTAEAHYTFLGAISSVPKSARHTSHLVIDIGGGSTEMVYGTASAIECQHSFPIGAVLIKDMFSLGECLLIKELNAIQAHVRDTFDVLPTISQPLSQPATVLLTGGTATTLAALDQQLVVYDIAAIDGHWMVRSTIEALYNRLNSMSLEKRTALPGMEPGRADIILPALAILLTLLVSLDIDAVQISVRGARYGILL